MANTPKKETTTVEEEVMVAPVENREAELEKELDAIKKQMAQLMELMTKQNETKEESKFTPSEPAQSDEEVYDEPNPHKQIRVMSLCFGRLNLSEEAGKSAKYKFSKFGEIKPILYSSLTEVVNNHRKFAESGYFYILDKSSVYCLGLSEDYKRIATKEMIDNIFEYDTEKLRDVFESMGKEQKQNITRLLCDRIYNGKQKVDLNKLDIIGKYAKVNFSEKLEEMKRYDKNVKEE